MDGQPYIRPPRWDDLLKTTDLLAERFNKAKIPHVLWGVLMLSFYVMDQLALFIEFVIPDHRIDEVAQILRDSGGVENPSRTARYDNQYGRLPDPSLDFSLQKGVMVLVHKQSEILWDISSLEFDGENVWSTDDERLTQRFPRPYTPELPPPTSARVLPMFRALECVIKLGFRDRETPFWRNWYRMSSVMTFPELFQTNLRLDKLEAHYVRFAYSINRPKRNGWERSTSGWEIPSICEAFLEGERRSAEAKLEKQRESEMES